MTHDARHESPDHWKNRLSRFLVRLLLPATLAVGAFMPVHADEPAPNEHTARHEVDFMQHTIDHHLYGIRTSELCTQRATTPELIELCTTTAANQQAELDQLQSWLQDWYGETHEPHLAQSQRDMLAQLETLSGGEFERSFLKGMVSHHVVGIKHAAGCEAELHHDELLTACATSVAMQAEEILTMRELLCDAYGICSLELRENPIADSPADDGAAEDAAPEDDQTPDDTPDDDPDDDTDDDDMPDDDTPDEGDVSGDGGP